MEKKEEHNSEQEQKPSEGQKPSEEQKVDKEQKPLSTNKLIVAGVICIVAYVVILLLSAARAQLLGIPFIGAFFAPLGFESPMFWVMPFFAFFALFFLIDWIKKGFESKLSFAMLCLAVFAIFVACSLAAYYVALYWYISNFASLQGIEMTPDMVDFWGKLSNSAFLLFIWGGMFGLLARYIVEKINL